MESWYQAPISVCIWYPAYTNNTYKVSIECSSAGRKVLSSPFTKAQAEKDASAVKRIVENLEFNPYKCMDYFFANNDYSANTGKDQQLARARMQYLR